MKKILALLVALIVFGATSCKKEEEAKPTFEAQKTIMGGDREVGNWD